MPIRARRRSRSAGMALMLPAQRFDAARRQFATSSIDSRWCLAIGARQRPYDLTLDISVDDSVFVSKSIYEVEHALVVALLLVLVVIYLFLGTVRATIIPAVTIPVSIIAACIVMAMADYSVNVLTLLGAVLAIGLVALPRASCAAGWPMRSIAFSNGCRARMSAACVAHWLRQRWWSWPVCSRSAWRSFCSRICPPNTRPWRTGSASSFVYCSGRLEPAVSRSLLASGRGSGIGGNERGNVRRFVTRSNNFGGGSDVNSGFVSLNLSEWDERTESAQQIAARLRKRLSNLVGVRVNVGTPGGLGVGGSGDPVQIVLGGSDYEELARWRDHILAKAAENPGLTNLESDYYARKPQLRVSVDRNRAGDLGVSLTAVGRTLETMMGSPRSCTPSWRATRNPRNTSAR